MKKFLIAVASIIGTSYALADDHASTLNLELRQPVSTMEVTSIHCCCTKHASLEFVVGSTRRVYFAIGRSCVFEQ